MSSREYVITQLNTLPDSAIDKVREFVAFQMFSLGLYQSDTEYLASIPGMAESIKAAANEPLEDCIDITEMLDDV